MRTGKGILSGFQAAFLHFFASLCSHEGWTQEDWAEDYAQKVRAYKQALKRHSQAAFDLIQPHLETFCEYATGYADQREENER